MEMAMEMTFDLHGVAADLLAEAAKRSDGRATRMLVGHHGQPLHQLVLALQADAELSEHAIAAGDRILAFTDGLYEVMDLLGGMLGLERVLAAATAGAPDGAFDRMVAARTAHQGGRKPDDDVCLVEVAV